jgi:hypothetical protein
MSALVNSVQCPSITPPSKLDQFVTNWVTVSPLDANGFWPIAVLSKGISRFNHLSPVPYSHMFTSVMIAFNILWTCFKSLIWSYSGHD